MARLALFVTIVLVLITFVLQQAGTSQQAGKAAPVSDTAPEVMVDPFSMISKMVVKFRPMVGPEAERFLEQVDAAAREPVERVRAAIVAAEIKGPEEAIERMTQLESQLGAPVAPGWVVELDAPVRDALASDVRTIREIYKGNKDAIDNARRDELIRRHGWFARVALSHGLADTDEPRAGLVGGGAPLLLLLAGFGLLVVGVVLGGLASFVIALVMLFNGKLRATFDRPAPGGSVYLETAAAFFAAFLGVKIVVSFAAQQGGFSDDQAIKLAMGAQWGVALMAFWALFRGVEFSRAARDLGWHRGQGVVVEVLCGVFGYLAGVPVFIAAVLLSLVVMMIRGAIQQAAGGPPPAPPENPIIELVGKGGWLPIMLFLLATVWAPLVEETVFRGALYRHARSRLPVVVAAVLTAVVFGVAHGYEVLMLGPVIALGFNFALMREWRGSLIAPVTAHFLHNATVLGFLLLLIHLLR
jgi:membrane protease YdiL (CAAX protease family)